jgi:ATP-dependent RNA helicase DDX54/DBP10
MLLQGLNPNLLKAITRKGFTVPTPIQRKTIPHILDRKDVVGMARTGSGKTAAFVIPMIERLKQHSVKVGARAVVFSPSRELALQTLSVVKELGKGTDLKTILLTGGDSMEEQFGYMATNPDIIIATPGRFLHLKVEMALDLASIQYVVFDEADRLFEMGFAVQLTEILYALPSNRQTLLFSATLPSTLVEFARAGLQDPLLIRLDTDSKISPDLESAFFGVKSHEREGALLQILHDVIRMPLGVPASTSTKGSDRSKKRKRDIDAPNPKEKPTEHSTIVFTATKHHVEYIANLLIHNGFSVSFVYGALDQEARRIQVDDFRRGKTHILVTTDVAARGIDIPILANVINYDFPPQPKVFVHRVGRTARAGQRGWTYNLVRESDAPYLLDLQLFLGRKLLVGKEGHDANFAEDIVVGTLPWEQLATHVEWSNKVLEERGEIENLRAVASRAEKQYNKSRSAASLQSAKRARDLVTSTAWTQLHPLFGDSAAEVEDARASMLAKISGFKPQESIFELGIQGHTSSRNDDPGEIMRLMRQKHGPRKRTGLETASEKAEDLGDNLSRAKEADENPDSDEEEEVFDGAMQPESDSEVEITISGSNDRKKRDWKDTDVFMSYTPRNINLAEERAYSVQAGQTSFAEAAKAATLDLTNDETATSFGASARPKYRWDKRHSKYVARANDEDGSKGTAMIKGESGVKIAASFRSGKFDEWRKAHRVDRLPKVGEQENASLARQMAPTGGFRQKRRKFDQAPKEPDKYRDDYYKQKKKIEAAKEKRIGRFRDGMGSKKELKSNRDITKARSLKARRQEKSGASSHRGGKGKGRR